MHLSCIYLLCYVLMLMLAPIYLTRGSLSHSCSMFFCLQWKKKVTIRTFKKTNIKSYIIKMYTPVNYSNCSATNVWHFILNRLIPWRLLISRRIFQPSKLIFKRTVGFSYKSREVFTRLCHRRTWISEPWEGGTFLNYLLWKLVHRALPCLAKYCFFLIYRIF